MGQDICLLVSSQDLIAYLISLSLCTEIAFIMFFCCLSPFYGNHSIFMLNLCDILSRLFARENSLSLILFRSYLILEINISIICEFSRTSSRKVVIFLCNTQFKYNWVKKSKCLNYSSRLGSESFINKEIKTRFTCFVCICTVFCAELNCI